MLHELSSEIRYRLRALFRRRAVGRELADELRFHLELETEKLVRAGVPRAEAERRALLGDRKTPEEVEALFRAMQGHLMERILRGELTHHLGYPTIAPMWQRQWAYVTPAFAYPRELRRVRFTTNAIESLHSQLRKILT